MMNSNRSDFSAIGRKMSGGMLSTCSRKNRLTSLHPKATCQFVVPMTGDAARRGESEFAEYAGRWEDVIQDVLAAESRS